MDIKEKALARTPAPIERVHANPFRNFGLNPLRGGQVERLQAGIEDIGMWSGLAARKIPGSTPAEYQLACGHHRLEALKRAGIDTVNLDVRPYTDEQMIRIMVEENMTQRGNENVGTVLDSVAAVIIQVVSENLGDKRNPDQDRNQAARIENGEGVGLKTITKCQPSISSRNSRDAIRILKVSGKYADLIEKGGAPKEVVDLYRADEAGAKPNILKAVGMFKKPLHGRAFAEATLTDGKTCDHTEDKYIDCAQSILNSDEPVKPKFVEQGVFKYFKVEHPAEPETVQDISSPDEKENPGSTSPSESGKVKLGNSQNKQIEETATDRPPKNEINEPREEPPETGHSKPPEPEPPVADEDVSPADQRKAWARAAKKLSALIEYMEANCRVGFDIPDDTVQLFSLNLDMLKTWEDEFQKAAA